MVNMRGFGPHGYFDLASVPVEDYEVAYALACYRRAATVGPAWRSPTVVRDNIALGKACGSYDPEPARMWWEREQDRTVITI